MDWLIVGVLALFGIGTIWYVIAHPINDDDIPPGGWA